jgi:hypothetical protein
VASTKEVRMSWSVSFFGTAEKVAEAIEAEGAKMTGQSKLEYEAAAPHLAALVRENFDKAEGANPPLIRISASGHGLANAEGGQVNRQCTVQLDRTYGKVLV